MSSGGHSVGLSSAAPHGREAAGSSEHIWKLGCCFLSAIQLSFNWLCPFCIWVCTAELQKSLSLIWCLSNGPSPFLTCPHSAEVTWNLHWPYLVCRKTSTELKGLNQSLGCRLLCLWRLLKQIDRRDKQEMELLIETNTSLCVGTERGS